MLVSRIGLETVTMARKTVTPSFPSLSEGLPLIWQYGPRGDWTPLGATTAFVNDCWPDEGRTIFDLEGDWKDRVYHGTFYLRDGNCRYHLTGYPDGRWTVHLEPAGPLGP